MEKDMNAHGTAWDEHAIKAEVRRRGGTLASLALASGYAASTLRAAFLRPHAGANRAIAQFIGQPLYVLWPEWFDRAGRLIPAALRDPSTCQGKNASRKRRAA
jgi:Ner family transcriptional regulator